MHAHGFSVQFREFFQHEYFFDYTAFFQAGDGEVVVFELLFFVYFFFDVFFVKQGYLTILLDDADFGFDDTFVHFKRNVDFVVAFNGVV